LHCMAPLVSMSSRSVDHGLVLEGSN
jgi:hypothetical protein